MKHSSAYRLRRWELALLLALAIAALWGMRLDSAQAALADKVIRLHVLAARESPEDQALKLLVRDRVLDEARSILPADGDIQAVEAALEANLTVLAQAGAQALAEEGCTQPVTVSLEHGCWFPTKQYDDISLPAGKYTALRVVIGEGGGQNWWCVVFPPLCLGSVTEVSQEAALSEAFSPQEVALLTGEEEGYVVKFKTMELLENFGRWLEGEA